MNTQKVFLSFWAGLKRGMDGCICMGDIENRDSMLFLPLVMASPISL